MRDILFRGKDKEGKWHLGYLYVYTSKDKKIYYLNYSTDINIPKYVEVEENTLRQMTESKDMTYRRIFEGDILKYIDSTEEDYIEIEYRNCCMVVKEYSMRNSDYDDYTSYTPIGDFSFL